MDKQRKIWLCEQYAQRTWFLSTNIAAEAARAGEQGRGYAVVAEETRTLANKIFNFVEILKFESDGEEKMMQGIEDCVVMMSLLSTNASIEAANMARISMDYNIPKSVAVFADDLRNIANGFKEISGVKTEKKPGLVYEVAKPSSLTNDHVELFHFSIGGISLVESITSKICEVIFASREKFADGAFRLREHNLPVINFYEKFGLKYTGNMFHPILIICPNPIDNDKYHSQKYAVPIDFDCLYDRPIFTSYFGTSVPVDKTHPFAEYARECWDAVGGGQMVFIDWERFVHP